MLYQNCTPPRICVSMYRMNIYSVIKHIYRSVYSREKNISVHRAAKETTLLPLPEIYLMYSKLAQAYENVCN